MDYGDTIEGQMICDYVAGGMTMVDACRTLGIPLRTNYSRLQANPKFRDMMEDARTNGYDVIAADVRRVARGEDGFSTGDSKRDRLVVETDLKLLSKWHPTRYGDKLQVEQKSATIAIPPSDDPIEAARAYEQFMKGY